jgi:hypothetical protein
MFLYQRPTVGFSRDISVTAVAAAEELVTPGLYHIFNMGPNIAYIQMYPADTPTHTAAITDMPVYPCISPWYHTLPVCIQIGMRDVKSVSTGLTGGHPADLNFLHHICDVTCTATLRITRVTKN